MSTMRALFVILAAASVGCSTLAPLEEETPAVSDDATMPPAPPPLPRADGCHPGVNLVTVFKSAESFIANLEGRAFSLTIEGQHGGEDVDELLSVDPHSQRLRVRDGSGNLDLRVDPVEYSVRMGLDGMYGRHADGGALFDEFYDRFWTSIAYEGAVRFSGDRSLEDFEVSCAEMSGVPIVRFTYARDGIEDVRVVERDGPHRPLSRTLVDPTLGHNIRASVSYHAANIPLERELPRAALVLSQEAIELSTNHRGGVRLTSRFDEHTQWSLLTDMRVALVDETNTVVTDHSLANKVYDLGNGNVFAFRDEDRNGKLSTGDTFRVDLARGFDIAFYDAWADRWTPWRNSDATDDEDPLLTPRLDRIESA